MELLKKYYLKKDHQYNKDYAYCHCTAIVEYQWLAQRRCQNHQNDAQNKKYNTIQKEFCKHKKRVDRQVSNVVSKARDTSIHQTIVEK